MSSWDSAALVPLLAEQQRTAEMVRHLKSDVEMVVWWASKAECASALARLFEVITDTGTG